jgi:hypothetical protein
MADQTFSNVDTGSPADTTLWLLFRLHRRAPLAVGVA